MPYITRADGERFIIPSYRDVLSAKKPGLLKREILLLATNYGEYINLQKKTATQYEVAFSPESGYLLGETVWQYFKRPRDFIFCETIPNTAEVILVIVKSGSVYLDGTFPIDSIPEELVVFQTQQNSFEIYIDNDAPISEHPEEGKFSFDSSAVKSFTILDKAIFPTLPIVKSFQLQLVDTVLKSQGIGVFPIKPFIILAIAAVLLWLAYNMFSTHQVELPRAIVNVVNPYQVFVTRLTSPDPSLEMDRVANNILLFSTIPGWYPTTFTYTGGALRVSVRSLGARTNTLFDWAKKNNVKVDVTGTGFFLTTNVVLRNRAPPYSIIELKAVIANLLDRLSYILPGNPLKIANYSNKGKYTEVDLTIDFTEISPTTLGLIADQLKRLPLILSSVTINITNGNLAGKIELKALGN